MENQNIVSKLQELHQLEVDANHAYETAIESFREQELKTTFSRFKRDHDRHLNEIEMLLGKRNAEVPVREKDLKGYLIDGMTRLRSSISDDQALKAMKQNEETVYNAYERAYRELRAQSPEVDSMIQKALHDEVKHYNYILSRLGEKTGYKDNLNLDNLSSFEDDTRRPSYLVDATKDKTRPQSTSFSEKPDYRNLH